MTATPRITLDTLNTEIEAKPLDAHNQMAAKMYEPRSLRELTIGRQYVVLTPWERKVTVQDNNGREVLVLAEIFFMSTTWIEKDGTVKEGKPFVVHQEWLEKWEIKTIGVLRQGREGAMENMPEQHLVVTWDQRKQKGINCSASILVPEMEEAQERAAAAGDYMPNYQIVKLVPYTGEPNAIQAQANREEGAGRDRGDGQGAQQQGAAAGPRQGANAGAVRK